MICRGAICLRFLGLTFPELPFLSRFSTLTLTETYRSTTLSPSRGGFPTDQQIKPSHFCRLIRAIQTAVRQNSWTRRVSALGTVLSFSTIDTNSLLNNLLIPQRRVYNCQLILCHISQIKIIYIISEYDEFTSSHGFRQTCHKNLIYLLFHCHL